MIEWLKRLIYGRGDAPVPPQLPDRKEINDCCKLPANLFLEQAHNQPQVDGTLVPCQQWRCSVCIKRHFVMRVGQRLEPGKVSIS